MQGTKCKLECKFSPESSPSGLSDLRLEFTHGVSGVDWSHYKHPLPGNVYDPYVGYWKDVRFEK